MTCKNCNCESCQTERARVKTWYDTDADCPLDWNGWRLLHTDKRSRVGECVSHPLSPSKRANVFPVYRMEHGAVAYSLAPFGCRWDSGLYGLLVCDPDTTREQAKAFLEAFSQWCNGEVYGYSKGDEHCGGFYSLAEIAETLGVSVETLANPK